MPAHTHIFTTIRTEGALLPADLLQRISEGASLDGLTAESYHRPGEKLNEAINRSWNALQGAWASFRAAQERLPENDLGTSITRERWLLPLFRELDYGRLQTATAVEIDGRSYPISHHWEHVPVHLVSYKLELDKRTPGVAGASTASPHSLLQVFLNRSDDHLWGFLSNGCRLRILRDNASLTRQAYVEFDLEAMMEGEVYSDFVMLWLLCHQSRVERDCWLEKWMKVAEDQGTRALDQLRDGVEKAIEALGLGFLEYPANYALRDQLTSGELNAQDYYRQLLRMVYRLLFLFVAEDRDLLLDPHADAAARERYVEYYSTRRLRRMAENFNGTRHPDLYECLRLVMRLLSGDSNGAGAGLGLVPLGSFLFSDAAVRNIIGCQMSNSHLLAAVRALSLTYDGRAGVYRTVDYRNLGSDELGSVFESLLELHPQIHVPERRFALSTAAGNERKTTGSYYTPESLVHALLDSALNPVLAEAIKPSETVGAAFLPSAEERILALKVCDPACGSGHFLIAAANRMAKALASVRTGEEEPPPAAIQEAKRDIISHCIYGVDINPMAVELCKVNLWMEALEPGKPLNFLDHRILVGNSLLGTTPKLMAGGIPDDAFNPIEGDDPKTASAMKKQNRDERKQRDAGVFQHGLFEAPAANYRALHDATLWIDRAPDETLAQVRVKERMYQEMAGDPEYVKARLLADAWCAAFVWEKTPPLHEMGRGAGGGDMPVLTDLLYRRMEADPLADNLQPVRETIVALADHYQFFHWHVAFPDVFSVPDELPHAENEQTGWHGGFDVVLGNPPWERIKIQEKEWFAERAPEIASAPNAAARRRAIADLAERDPYLLQAFADDKRKAEGESHFVRVSDRYPLCGRGDVNTYTIFAETSRHVINGYGRVGMIVPSGIATDDTTKFFFGNLMETGSLISIYSFENEEKVFPSVHNQFKFCMLTMTGLENPVNAADFVFFARQVSNLEDESRHFTLSLTDVRAINPNTNTCATFRSKRDSEIIKSIYQRISVLIQETPNFNSWGVSFFAMFHLTNDSHLFNDVPSHGQVPLYEAKLFHQYDHRFSTYEEATQAELNAGRLPQTSPNVKSSPSFAVKPHFWVDAKYVDKAINQDYRWFLSFRDVTNSVNERTCIFCIVPRTALGNSAPILLTEELSLPFSAQCLLANLNSFALDYVVRQKISGTHMNFFLVKQLPVIPPHTYTPALLDFIVPRVLELTYTAWDLQPFAQDVGWDGAPFVWDEERRFLMRCELDALYFHLYRIARDDVDYIMETFPIVKRKDIARTSPPRPESEREGYRASSSPPRPEGEGDLGGEGFYLTKRIILEMYDQMAALPVMHVPAPKDESATVAVPDVGQWATWLEPPPGDARAAHGVVE